MVHQHIHFRRQRGVRVPRVESALPLVEVRDPAADDLYLQPGGIRDRLLVQPNRQKSEPWLWANSFSRGRTKSVQVLDAAKGQASTKPAVYSCSRVRSEANVRPSVLALLCQVSAGVAYLLDFSNCGGCR